MDDADRYDLRMIYNAERRTMTVPRRNFDAKTRDKNDTKMMEHFDAEVDDDDADTELPKD